MEGMKARKVRWRNGHIGLATKTGDDRFVLERLLEGRGCNATFEARAECLGSSAAALCRAYKGQPVSAELIFAVRTTFPDVPYGLIFEEVRSDVPREVQAA